MQNLDILLWQMELKQGGVISPIFFSLYIDPLLDPLLDPEKIFRYSSKQLNEEVTQPDVQRSVG